MRRPPVQPDAPVALDTATAGALPPEAVLARLGSGPQGLASGEAAARRARVGPNLLRTRRETALAVLVRQLRNPLLLLLLGAAAVSGLTGSPIDALIIATIVLLSVGLGFTSEYRAAHAVAALHADIRYRARVWRDGVPAEVPTAELVPGDIVALAVGDIVPADVRLLEPTRMECDESVLTGESQPAAKSPAAAGEPAPALSSCAYMGTVVHEGAGRGVVVATGMATSFGHISAGLSEREAETAFQVGLREFSGFLARVAGVLTVFIFVVNVAFSRPLLETLLFSLAIAIGITPQLLPAIVSVSLSTGSRALARKRVLVKRLVTIEDLGNVEILFTDKTGTLTDGAITFTGALDPRGRPAREVLLLGLLCNEASATEHGVVGGNALDAAVMRAPGAAPLLAAADGVRAHVRQGALPFDHVRRLASVVTRDRDGARTLITKGAPETVLERCTDVPAEAHDQLTRLFEAGARVVAIATRPAEGLAGAPAAADERDLRLAGFLTFADRPKAGAAEALGRLARLGIAVKVITGDSPVVAAAVCRDLGLAVDGVVGGAELERLDDDALAALIPRTTIFGRVGPDQKSRLVKVARRTGADIGFLGDGVNDAVALHAADVGISVDSAADIAKDAADIVLLDKDLGVLADGVAEGRRIFANTLKYVMMATSSNFGNMFSAAGASLFLSFLPMLPSQVLLNNLLYDAGQLAIPTDRVDPEVVARPAAWDIAFVRRFMAVFGPLSSIFDFLTFFVMLVVLNAGQDEFRSGWFVESLATQTLVIYVIRTRRVPFLRSRPSRPMMIVPPICALVGAVLPFTPLAEPLGFATLPIAFFLILLGMIASYLVLVEVAKARFYAIQAHPRRARPTRAERHQRRVHRRAARFHPRPRFPHRRRRRTARPAGQPRPSSRRA